MSDRYIPKVGDKVKVLVDEDIYGDDIDASKPHYIDIVDSYNGNVFLYQFVRRSYKGVNQWEVAASDVKLWYDSYDEINLPLEQRLADLERRLSKAESDLRIMRDDIKGIDDDVQSIRTGDSIPNVDTIVREINDATELKYTREQVIQMAKDDVERLLRTRHDNVGRLSLTFNPIPDEIGGCDTVRFVINRKKRTVVTLINWSEIDATYKPWVRGIAKAAPDDVFNAHIGKAISLRRALGLDVPDYYINAPMPTQAKVGDIVTFPNVKDTTQYCVTETSRATNYNLRIVKDSTPGFVGMSAYAGYNFKNAIYIDDTGDFGGEQE